MKHGNISNRTFLTRVGIYIILGCFAVSMLLPFFWMVSTSLKGELEVYQFPPTLFPEKARWGNYTEALTILPFGRFFLNTFIMTFSIVIGQLLICSLAGYAFARMNFPGKDKWFVLYLSTMMLPLIVLLIPRYLLVNALGWVDTYWGLILTEINSVWGIFLLRQFFSTLPLDLEDAARLDGASEFKIYWRIILPLSKPALATLGLFSFVWSWQSFLWPLIVTDSLEMRPVEVGIAMFHSMYQADWTFQMAAAVTIMVPTIALFLFTQRYFVKGIALTGLKT